MILVNNSELGAGTRGASLGFDALRIISLEENDPINKVNFLKNENEHLFSTKKDFPSAINIDAINKLFYDSIEDCKEYFMENENHFIYSADHSNTPLYLAALRNIDPNEKIGVIWVDAHGDLHSPYTTPSGNMHGMPLCIALNEDNLDMKKRELDNETIELWEKLKSLGTNKSKINYENLVFLGIRDLEREEKYLIENNDVFYKKVPEVRNQKIEVIVEQIENKLKTCDRLFISFDVDSMDPNDTSYGTGTPVEGGFTLQESFEITDRLTKIQKPISFEMVEINPLLDTQNKMARSAFKIFKNVNQNLKIEY
jgi:arginase